MTDNKPQLQSITILTGGSRGDIQPYIAIGAALQRTTNADGQQYRVRILTNVNHRAFVEEFGLEHVTMFADFDKLAKTDPIIKNCAVKGDTAGFFQAFKRVSEGFASQDCANFVGEIVRVGRLGTKSGNGEKSSNMDLLVLGSYGTYYGLYATYVLGIPTIQVQLQSVTENPNHAPWGMPTIPDGKHKDVLKFMMGGSYDAFKFLDESMSTALNEAGCCEPDGGGLQAHLSKSTFVAEALRPTLTPRVVCQSPLYKDALHPYASKPETKDEYKMLRLVGAAIIDASEQGKSLAAAKSDVEEKETDNTLSQFGSDDVQRSIEEFLGTKDDNDAPVYCGWGSMTCKSPEHMVKFAVRALRASGRRGIIAGGWAGLSYEMLEQAVQQKEERGTETSTLGEKENVEDNNCDGGKLLEYARERILFVPSAPHEILFPRVACIVHHGGAGTTNASLRSGRPTIITPVFMDQYDHAYLVNELGAGIGFSKQWHQIQAEELGKAIADVVTKENYLRRAKEVGEELQKEDGAAAVVREIEQFWTDFVLSEKFQAIVEEEREKKKHE